MAAVLEAHRIGIQGVHPGAHRPRASLAGIEAGHRVAIAGGPDDVGIPRRGEREAGLASADAGVPLGCAAPAACAPAASAASAPAATSPEGRNVRHGNRGGVRATHRAVVLPVAVDPVRHLVVHGHVVHLADRQHKRREALPVVPRVSGAGVAGRHPVRRVARVHPDVVAIPAAAARDRERLPAVERPVEAAVRHQHLKVVLRIHGHADVVAGAPDEAPVPAHHLPLLTAVVGAPERSLVGGLDQPIDPLGVRRRHGHVDLPTDDRGVLVGNALPGGPGVARHVHAPRPAAEHGPGVHHHLPGADEQHLGTDVDRETDTRVGSTHRTRATSRPDPWNTPFLLRTRRPA